MKKLVSIALACVLVCQFTANEAIAANEKQVSVRFDQVEQITKKQNRTIKAWKHRVDAIENNKFSDLEDDFSEASNALKDAQDSLKDVIGTTAGIDPNAEIALGAFYSKVNSFCEQSPAIGASYSALSDAGKTNALMQALVYFHMADDPALETDATKAAQKQQELQQMAQTYQQRFSGKESTYEDTNYWLVQSIGANTAAIEGILSALEDLDIQSKADDAVDLANSYIAEMEDQAAQGAENVYLAVYKLEAQRTALKEKQEYAAFAVKSARAQYRVGMITKAELMAIEAKLPEIQNGTEKLDHTIAVLQSNLAILMGYDSQTTLIMETPKDDYITTIESILYEQDKAKAQKANHAIRQAKQSQKTGNSDDLHDAATATLQQAEEQFEADFKATYDALMDANKEYILEKTKFDAANEAFRVVKLSYEVGLKSGLEYRAAKDRIAESTETLEKARLSLIEARRAYDWAVNGLTANSLSAVQAN